MHGRPGLRYDNLVPYIGRYASSHLLVCGHGFRKWGMTHSMVSAAIISTMIAKKAPILK